MNSVEHFKTKVFLQAAVNNPGPSRISVPELIHQLQVTQDELENIRVSSLKPLSLYFAFVADDVLRMCFV